MPISNPLLSWDSFKKGDQVYICRTVNWNAQKGGDLVMQGNLMDIYSDKIFSSLFFLRYLLAAVAVGCSCPSLIIFDPSMSLP